VDARTDIYGLGAILFEVLTNRPPHHGEDRTPDPPSPRAVNAAVPAALDRVATRAMSPDPADRYPDALALAADVQRWLADEPIAAHRALVEAFASRADAAPGSADFREQLARSQANLGLVLDGMGRHAESEGAFRAAIDEYSRLAEAQPAQARFRAELATARVHFSRVLLATGRSEEAQRMQQAAVAEFERLMLGNPRDYRTNLASVMLSLMPGAEVRPPEVPSPPPEPGGGTTIDSPAAPTEGLEAPAGSEFPLAPPGLGADDAEKRARMTIIRRVAAGGMSEIWLAQDGDLNREVAIKILLGAHDESRRRFFKEAQIAAQLEHPNIIPVYGLGHRARDGVPFIIMRYVPGETLLEACRKRDRANTRELRTLVGAVAETCGALAYAHSRGVIHRDPKPANILLGPAGEAVVADRGLAKLVGTEEEVEHVGISLDADPGATHAGEVMGTPSYMAPELARGRASSADARTDVYIRGATLYEVLTGQPPYRGWPLQELFRHVISGDAPAAPPALVAVCAKAMATDPADRYATAAELHRDLAAWLAGEPVSVYHEGRVTRWWRAFWSRWV
jgi:serine/threonine protein kinase